MLQLFVRVSAVLLLTTPPNVGQTASQTSQGAVPTFASLTADQRNRLPDHTRVSVGKYLVTLGALRAAHQARAMHVASAASAGSAAGQALSSLKGIPVGIDPALLGKVSLLGVPVIEPATEFADNALDQQKFCNAAQAAVCLYYPASTTLFQGGGWSSEIDPYITDVSLCKSGGGDPLADGCQYNYDAWHKALFSPGSGFTYKVACDAKYWNVVTVDKHGAILVHSVIPGGTTFSTGASPSSCVIRVWVKP